MEVMLKRIYESAEASDEYRILTDRLWTRGISREKYLQELDHNPGKEDFLSRVKSHLKEGRGTLLYGARDREHNQAVVLHHFLEEALS